MNLPPNNDELVVCSSKDGFLKLIKPGSPPILSGAHNQKEQSKQDQQKLLNILRFVQIKLIFSPARDRFFTLSAGGNLRLWIFK